MQNSAELEPVEASDSGETVPEANETWKVAIAPGKRPFAMEENGQLVGFDVDLIKALSKVCGAIAQVQAQPFDALIPMLRAKQIDMGLGSVVITEQPSKSILFSKAYFGSGVAIVTTSENQSLKNLKSLQEKAIAVELNTVGAQLASDILGSRILTYDQSSEVLKAVETVEADAALIELPILLDALKTGTVSQLQQNGKLLAAQDFGIVFRVNEDESSINRIAAINSALSTLEADGTLNDLYQRWLGISL
ncbi:MAG: transporter substrate-binding domain-containing protein [Phormidesmis sp.]